MTVTLDILADGGIGSSQRTRPSAEDQQPGYGLRTVLCVIGHLVFPLEEIRQADPSGGLSGFMETHSPHEDGSYTPCTAVLYLSRVDGRRPCEDEQPRTADIIDIATNGIPYAWRQLPFID